MNGHQANDRICKACPDSYTERCKGIKNCPRHPKKYTVEGLKEISRE